MKTKFQLGALAVSFLLYNSLSAQSNFTVQVPAGQEVHNLSGNICCFFRNNVATDENGNSYVLSEIPSDSSIWVTKYNTSGVVVYNTRVGVLGYETNYHYRAKKIRVYDKVYVLAHTNGPLGNNPNYQENEQTFILDKNTGVVDQVAPVFSPYYPDTGCELVDLAQAGNRLWIVGQTKGPGGLGSNKIHVMRWDPTTWNGNSYRLGSDPSTDYLLNTESPCLALYNDAVYLTGQAPGSTTTRIFIAKLDAYGLTSDYLYTNPTYSLAGKGLNIAVEGNSVYVVGGVIAAGAKQTYKAAMLKIDTSLTTLAWATINKNSVWPLGMGLTSADVIYTVDFTLQVVGFSKTTGNQLFAKSDFKNYAQVYNQPISTVVLNNNQLMLQASIGVKLNGNSTTNKVTAKYSTTGMKVYQQLESISNISPGNPGSAEALGLSYSSAANRTTELYRISSSSGTTYYVNSKGAPTSLRIARDEDDAALLSVFPNPADESFSIKSDGNIASWILYDMTMRKIMSGEQAGNEVSVDCRHFTAGMYFISIQTDAGEMLTRKVMVR